MRNKTNIRHAEPTDVEKIFRLGRSEPGVRLGKVRFYTKKEVSEWIADRTNNIVLVAEIADEIIGFQISKIMSYDWVMPDNTIVLKAHQGYGVGTLLNQRLMKEMRGRKLKFLGCFVPEDNSAARKMLKNLGFKEDENRRFVWADRYVRVMQ